MTRPTQKMIRLDVPVYQALMARAAELNTTAARLVNRLVADGLAREARASRKDTPDVVPQPPHGVVDP